jgi:excisionase family DNA binding protein
MGHAADDDGLLTEVKRLTRKAEEHEREIARIKRHRSEVLDIEGAAELLLCSIRTVERMVRSNRIPHAKIHGQRGLRFLRTDLTSWLRRGAPKPGTSRLHSGR